MAVNIHLRNLDHVAILAQQVAQQTQQDQAIYKTKDSQRYEIFQFIPAYLYKGTAIRVIRYSGENISENILPDTGNERPEIADTDTKPVKTGKRRTVKRDLDKPA